MRKALSLLLIFVMLLSLCACGKDDAQSTDPGANSTQATTEGTEDPTDGTAEGTQAPTEDPTAAPTEGPTAAPTETPATNPTACSHSYKDATCTTAKTCTKCGATDGSAAGHTWKAATCTTAKTCSKCGKTEGKAAGHKYENGTCTGCGDVEKITHTFGTGTGYAVTLSPDKTELTCYSISASELMYDLCTTEKPASGWYKFREHKGTTYYSPSPSWGWLEFSSHTISGRTVQLNVGPETMELELIGTNQYKVTKGMESIPAGIVFTFGDDMCNFAGHLYERSCENDVTCMYCGHFKCAGLGHEYGENDICFRCFSAMRPSN